jgi:hypothetical protein
LKKDDERVKILIRGLMKKPSIFYRVLFLIIFCNLMRIPYSFSKRIDFLERNQELNSQHQTHKKLSNYSEEEFINIWRNYLEKYPVAKDAIELELMHSFPTEDLVEKDIYLWRPVKLDGDISGNIFISDQKWCHIFKFDSSGDFIKIIGRKGQGPGEFMNPYCLTVTKDFLVVSDTNGRKIQFFDRDGKYLKSIKTLKPYFEIVADAEGIIYASPLRWNKESLLIDVLDKDGHIINSFGKARFGSETSWNIPNMLKLAMNNKGEIFVAYENFPTVCKYSRKGELLDIFRIEKGIMKEREQLNLNAIRQKKSISYPVIYDIRTGRDGFYILNNYPRTHILEFDTNGKQINDYYYVKSHDYLVTNFFVKETGKNDKIFFILQEAPDHKVDVFGVKKK